MIARTYRTADGVVHPRTDQELVEAFLTGYVDIYRGGALEQMQDELVNLRVRTAELLLALDHAAVVKHCEGLSGGSARHPEVFE